jgi:hypothetical protein
MAFLRYTLLRVLVFAVVAALLWIVGFRGFWLLLIAVFLSGVVSVFVLTKSRDAASAALAHRVEEIKRRMAERAAAEDAWAETQRASESDRPAAVEDAAPPPPTPGDDRRADA